MFAVVFGSVGACLVRAKSNSTNFAYNQIASLIDSRKNIFIKTFGIRSACTHRVYSRYQNDAQQEDRELAADDGEIRNLNSVVNIAEDLELPCIYIDLPRVQQHNQN
jgi:hypothetical protein